MGGCRVQGAGEGVLFSERPSPNMRPWLPRRLVMRRGQGLGKRPAAAAFRCQPAPA